MTEASTSTPASDAQNSRSKASEVAKAKRHHELAQRRIDFEAIANKWLAKAGMPLDELPDPAALALALTGEPPNAGGRFAICIEVGRWIARRQRLPLWGNHYPTEIALRLCMPYEAVVAALPTAGSLKALAENWGLPSGLVEDRLFCVMAREGDGDERETLWRLRAFAVAQAKRDSEAAE